MTTTTNRLQVKLFGRNAEKYDRYNVSLYFEKQGMQIEHNEVIQQILDNQIMIEEMVKLYQNPDNDEIDRDIGVMNILEKYRMINQ